MRKISTKNRISEGSAIELLKRIFKNTTSDLITLEEAYVAADRSHLPAETNRNWLNNVMTKLSQHNLIVADYKYDGRKRLNGIKLTIAGKTALNRNTQSNEANARVHASASTVFPEDEGITSYNDVAQAVRAFRDANPEYEVIFSVTLKEVQQINSR
jgi:hypothetical protein